MKFIYGFCYIFSMTKVDFIARYGEESYEKLLAQQRVEILAGKITLLSEEQIRKGGV